LPNPDNVSDPKSNACVVISEEPILFNIQFLSTLLPAFPKFKVSTFPSPNIAIPPITFGL